MANLWSFGVAQIFWCLMLSCYAQATTNFTVVGGQIYTPGLAIIDAPQPYTPEGGDLLQVAIEISGNGRIQLPPYSPDVETGIFNITMFLFSYSTGLNLTISNGTSEGWSNDTSEAHAFHCNSTSLWGFQNAGCQEIMAQEPGSTVKHVNWAWPNCLVGDGDREDSTSRGPYNISIHQSFRINGTEYYTIFNLPIEVSNAIPNNTQLSTNRTRPLCALRNNPLQHQTAQDASTHSPTSQPYLGGNLTIAGSSQNESNAGSRSCDNPMMATHLVLVALISVVLI